MKRFLSLFVSVLLIAALASGICGAALADGGIRVRTLWEGVPLCNAPDGSQIATLHGNAELDVYDTLNGWYYVYCNGIYGWVSESTVGVVDSSAGRTGGNDPYDMGVPDIGNTVFGKDSMNLVVFWVQTQLKATGVWYQGYQWDVTGNLGDHTMQEISSFMQTMGYPGHSGVVDRNVINALSQYLGTGIVRVDIGGFYRGLKSLSRESSWGSMTKVMSNMIDGVPRVTLGARWIQVVLKRLGYYSGPIDGKYGEKTEAAVMKFQKDHGFQERNYLTLGVARCMLEQYYYAGGDVDQLP